MVTGYASNNRESSPLPILSRIVSRGHLICAKHFLDVFPTYLGTQHGSFWVNVPLKSMHNELYNGCADRVNPVFSVYDLKG